jgi:hypothetical protein
MNATKPDVFCRRWTKKTPTALALVGALALAACGDEARSMNSKSGAGASRTSREPGPSVEAAQRSGLAPPAAATARFAFERVEAPPPEWDVENRARRDPKVDGWPTEVFHDKAKPRFDALLRRAFGVASETIPLRDLLDGGFEGASVLRPELRDVSRSSACRVLRPAVVERERKAPGELEALFAELRKPTEGVAPRLGAQIESVEEVEGGYRTQVRWLACSNAPTGLVQQDARWLVTWRERGESAPPSVRSIELVEYTETSAPRPLFADHTQRWLADSRSVAEDLRPGLSERYFRNDSLTGNAMLGGQGVAIGDVNGDGLEDVYVPMQGGVPNRLLQANPDGTVRDVTSVARLGLLDNTRAALIVDLDGDGMRDIVLAVRSNLIVAYNDGQSVFKDQLILRAPGTEEFFSIAAADPDNDGDLDLYACRYVQGGMIAGVPTPYHDAQNGASNVYWRNDGRGRFTDATAEVGFDRNNSRFSLSALWEDLDDDGDVDLYVTNDFGRNNLYRNDGGRFVDVAGPAGAEDPAAGMGVTAADVDLDGRIDLYVSNMYSAAGLRIASQRGRFLDGKALENHAHYLRHARGNTLLRGLGDGRFEDATERFGVGVAGWAWGALFVDFDGDGFEDLFSPNGFTTEAGAADVESFFWRRVISQSPQDARATEGYRNAWASMQRMVMEDGASYNGNERDTAFLNLGGAGFADASFICGLDALSDSRSAARIDWDDDGRLDLLIKSRSGPRLRFLRNQARPQGPSLSLELVGRTCNLDAIGAQVTVELEGRTLRKTVHAGEGYLAQSSRRLHFGLGDRTLARRVTVRWPNGVLSSYENLAGGAHYRLVEGQAEATRAPLRKLELFEESAPSPLAPLDGPLVRVPLAERLPMAAYSFSMLDGSQRKVRDFGGAPLVVTLWSAKGAGCLEQLNEIAALSRERAGGLQWILATLDQGADLLEARRLASSLGLADRTAVLDPHSSKLLELQFLFVIGRSHHVPLPTSLVFDAQGQWCLAYLGAAARAELASDLDLVAQLEPNSRGTNRLTGGRWLSRGSRDFAFLAGVCRDLGANELAQFYAEIAAGQSK